LESLPEVVSLIVVVHSRAGSEGDAAQDFGEAGLADDGELLLCRYGCVGIGEAIVDGDEPVWIRAYVTVAADGSG
jgi:hypothetical protein